MLHDLRTSLHEPAIEESPTDWVIALAGGEGTRLAPYIERRFGERVPKQYCRLLGGASTLERTLDLLGEITPAARTLTVIGADHTAWAMPQLAGRSDHVFRQPSSRDTGVALFVALAMVKRWAPNAIVTITPCDQHVAPGPAYVAQIAAARAMARELRDTVVLVGATPTQADPELGYIVLDGAHDDLPAVHRVRGFVEKPAVDRAEELVASGALWNTMVACASVDALWELGRATQPELVDIVESLVPLIGTSEEDGAIELVYNFYPVNWSREMLERAPERLAVLPLVGVAWSDWGTEATVEAVVGRRPRRATQLRGCGWRVAAGRGRCEQPSTGLCARATTRSPMRSEAHLSRR